MQIFRRVQLTFAELRATFQVLALVDPRGSILSPISLVTLALIKGLR